MSEQVPLPAAVDPAAMQCSAAAVVGTVLLLLRAGRAGSREQEGRRSPPRASRGRASSDALRPELVAARRPRGAPVDVRPRALGITFTHRLARSILSCD
jgi:hypothetical protein